MSPEEKNIIRFLCKREKINSKEIKNINRTTSKLTVAFIIKIIVDVIIAITLLSFAITRFVEI